MSNRSRCPVLLSRQLAGARQFLPWKIYIFLQRAVFFTIGVAVAVAAKS